MLNGMLRLNRRPRKHLAVPKVPLAEILALGQPVARPQNSLWGAHSNARNYVHRGDRGADLVASDDSPRSFSYGFRRVPVGVGRFCSTDHARRRAPRVINSICCLRGLL